MPKTITKPIVVKIHHSDVNHLSGRKRQAYILGKLLDAKIPLVGIDGQVERGCLALKDDFDGDFMIFTWTE